MGRTKKIYVYVVSRQKEFIVITEGGTYHELGVQDAIIGQHKQREEDDASLERQLRERAASLAASLAEVADRLKAESSPLAAQALSFEAGHASPSSLEADHPGGLLGDGSGCDTGLEEQHRIYGQPRDRSEVTDIGSPHGEVECSETYVGDFGSNGSQPCDDTIGNGMLHYSGDESEYSGGGTDQSDVTGHTTDWDYSSAGRQYQNTGAGDGGESDQSKPFGSGSSAGEAAQCSMDDRVQDLLDRTLMAAVTQLQIAPHLQRQMQIGIQVGSDELEKKPAMRFED